MSEEFIVLKNIEKHFAGVLALKDVSMTINKGEIRCLAGENGSGKSTLIKVIAGVYPQNSGTIIIDNKEHKRLHPIDAIREGIQVIYQDFSLFPNLTVEENLSLNSLLEERKNFINWSNIRKIANEAIEKIEVKIDLKKTVGELSVADKQIVAISKALLQNAKLIIMDEPTTALTQREVDSLFQIIKKLQKTGIAILFVSHKLREVLEISEKLTILRNGIKVAEDNTSNFDEAKIVYFMTGRSLCEERFEYKKNANDKPLLKIENISRKNSFENISFDLYKGEILGITGLLGSGRTELALALFGVIPYETGNIYISDKSVKIKNIQSAIKNKIAYVPEDRLTEGLFLEQSIKRNVFISILSKLKNKIRLLDFIKMKQLVNNWIGDLKIVTSSVDLPVKTLSGGNQQRVVLAKWLATEAKILILNGPTVGVDIGSKADIHEKLRSLAKNGMGIIIISDDIPEVVQNCNRIIIMHKGKIAEEIQSNECDFNSLGERINRLK